MYFLDKLAKQVAQKLYTVAGSAIVLMMLLTCADVALRYFRHPIPGTYELVCFLGATAVAFAMAHTSVEGGHVAVSLVVRLLPRRLQALVETLTAGFGLMLFAFIARHSLLYGNELRASGEVSLTLEIPFYPFVYGVGVSAAAVCLVLLVDMLKNIVKVFAK